MIVYNLELRRLLLYPHKFIPYNLKPRVIKLPMFELAKIYFEVKLEQSQNTRQRLKLGLDLEYILQEYKQWVDSLEISKIISKEEQCKIIFELQKTRQGTAYLYNMYKCLVFSKTLKKLTRLEMEMANPFIYYHIQNYNKLHNNFRESIKNYFLPNYLDVNF